MAFATGGVVFLAVPFVAAFGRDDELVAGQKLFANFNGLVQQAAGIAAQIEDERLHAFGLKLFKAVFEVVGGLFAKLRQADVANFVFTRGGILFCRRCRGRFRS